MKTNQLSKRNQKTLEQLEKKYSWETRDTARMPQLKYVSLLLEELGVEHKFGDTSYSPDIRPSGRAYRTRDGITRYGSNLSVRYNGIYIGADSSVPYYSWNTFGYAKDLLRIIEDRLEDCNILDNE